MSGDSQSFERPPSNRGWPLAFAWVGTVLILVGAALFVFWSMRRLPGEVIDKTGQTATKIGSALKEVLTAFNQGQVVTSFTSYATQLHANQFLQVATLHQREIFTQVDSKRTGFGYIPLPDVEVEARAPVQFTYYLDLKTNWQFTLRDDVIFVRAPDLQFNEPAVDASALTFEVKKSSILRDADRAKENLKNSLTAMVRLRAQENIQLVRENARKEVGDFVQQWLVRSFSDGANRPVRVFFPGEVVPGETPQPASIKVE